MTHKWLEEQLLRAKGIPHGKQPKPKREPYARCVKTTWEDSVIKMRERWRLNSGS